VTFFWVLSLILGVISVLLAVVVRVVATLETRRFVLRNEVRHVSGVPLVGSFFGFFAVLLAPMGTLTQRFAWSWVPLAVEVTVFGLALVYWNLSGLRKLSERQRLSRKPR
jgi:hypothetical protein